MALLTWSDKFSVGVRALDDQHAGLFEASNQLHAAMMKGQAQSMTGPLLAKLVEYTHEHFAAEEAMMAATKYPNLGQHRVKHRELIKQVNEYVARHERGEIALNTDLLNFLRDWLTTHIQMDDRQYGPWMHEHRVH